MKALKRKSDSDYILRKGHQSVWITVDNISVYVRRTDEGVAVDLYPVGDEMEDAICGTWALFTEAEPDDTDQSELDMQADVAKNSPPLERKML